MKLPNSLLIPNSKRFLARLILARRDKRVDPELKASLQDPLIFCEQVLGFRLFEYQKKLMQDNAKRICACMGRQTGKSMTVSAKAIYFAMTNPKTTTLIISATLRQSMLMFDKILAFVYQSKAVQRSTAYRTRTRIQLKNGSWIIALPCGRTGATLRGHMAHLAILDEAAFIPEEVITSVVLPMLSTTDGYCWMLSTPYDRDHVFYKAFNDPSWSVYHLPSSANPLISKEFLEEQRKLVGEINFRQEYEAEFVDDYNAYLPMPLIRSCVDPELGEECEPRKWDEPTYAGYDPGGKRDPAALVAVTWDEAERVFYVRYAKTWMEQDYTTTNHAVADICSTMKVEKLCVDQTGLGNPIMEHLSEICRAGSVEGINFTQRTKEELLLNLKLLFEQKLIRIPNDRELLASLNCITYERTHAGGYRFESLRGTHDDLAYALALAVWAARQGSRGVVVEV